MLDGKFASECLRDVARQTSALEHQSAFNLLCAAHREMTEFGDESVRLGDADGVQFWNALSSQCLEMAERVMKRITEELKP